MNFSINQLLPWLVVPLGLAFAVWAGVAITDGETAILLAVLAAVMGIALVLGTGRGIWLLIPLCWPLTGSISVLPLPFNVQELAVMGVFGVYCAQVAMKQFRGVKRRFDYLDFFIGLNLAVIALMYLRNPVGVSALGSEMVGGRPYLKVAIGFMAFLVLSRIVVQPKLAYWFPAIMLGPNFIVAALNTVTYVFPQLTPLIAPFYSGINVQSYMQEEFGRGAGPTTLQEGRFQGLAALGLPMISALVAYFSPSKIMGFFARPSLFVLMLLALFFVGMAGFRNALFQAIIFILMAAYIWERGIGVFRMLALGVVAIALVITVQTISPLPNSIQRSLSFIPGPWSENVKQGSKESTDWRVEMWQIALTTDRYIQNKYLGDGFGFTAKELEIMRNSAFGGTGFLGEDAQKESFMIQGSFHSGPVSTIRFAGYLGLLIFLMLAVANATYSIKMLKLAWNTPYQPLAILSALGNIYGPFSFIFIFGEYRDALPGTLFACGMLKMLHNSLREYHAERSREPLNDDSDQRHNTTKTSGTPQPALVGVHFSRR